MQDLDTSQRRRMIQMTPDLLFTNLTDMRGKYMTGWIEKHTDLIIAHNKKIEKHTDLIIAHNKKG